ncbi:heterokaryon incompatibility protein-domain-containing protein [Podospora australis]|uniref:Heterokaryon incompatibility protein-domain-containing protein n=1 Tax=Podospora australis TaxID=1536484 RepID=A0AAN7AKD4_9PEZI|nr:heterokaryon incompatibility protein-domain-containing protein [Podospora australis]
MLCQTCLSVFEGPTPRLDETTSRPFGLDTLRTSIALGCFICCGLRDNLRIDTMSKNIDSLDRLLGIDIVQYKFEIMGLINDRITKPGQSRYCYLTVTWKCEIEHPGWERWMYQLVQWPLQPTLENPRWDEQLACGAIESATSVWLSEKVAAHISQWLSSCVEQHTSCNGQPASDTSTQNFYPSRLISVGNGIVRLIETTETIPTGHYLTLSHRWPTDASAYTLLEHANLDTLKASIDTSALSKVFQDAITCTRILGAEYIWIDSLCIIQDSKEDWEAESATMAEIYSQSYCNLSATADECKEQGLQHPRRHMQFSHERATARWDPVATDEGEGSIEPGPSCLQAQDYVLYDPNFWTRRVDQQELFTRGWVFQEQQLAPRILHFAPDQLLWECRQHRAGEEFPSGLPQKEMGWGEDWRSNPAATVVKGALAADQGHTDGPTGFYPTLGLSPWLVWQQVVGHYTRLSLTNGRDALVALAGVARMYQRLYQSRYFAGHWEEDFVFSLIWRISTEGHAQNCPSTEVQRPENFRKPEASQYTAPSWSWASVDTAVVGYDTRLSPTYAAEIIQKAVISSTGDPFGTLTDGYLLLKGPIFPAKLSVNARFNLKVMVGLLVDGCSGPVWTVDLDLCCRRHPDLNDTINSMGEDITDSSSDEDSEGTDQQVQTDDESDGNFDPDWDQDTLSRRYPSVYYLPIFEGTVTQQKKTPTENRIGWVLEPESGMRGVYKRIGLCFDKLVASRGWRLPPATAMMKSQENSHLYLDVGQNLFLVV